jgi:hypothetical protein
MKSKKLQFIDQLRQSVHSTRRVAKSTDYLSPSAVVETDIDMSPINNTTELTTRLTFGSSHVIDELALQEAINRDTYLNQVYDYAASLIVSELYGELELELRNVYRTLYLESRGQSKALTGLSDILDSIRP